jgi:hypothetical protein
VYPNPDYPFCPSDRRLNSFIETLSLNRARNGKQYVAIVATNQVVVFGLP